MAKILLVEDDNNLSEIYQARLQAEGYEIVSAHDGEEALALAAKEKPDLIISDVMMPKISGFEMLDILRNTDGLKTTKVIMLTALGQAEDKTRAESMGADRYLVKSQVTLEDIVKAAKDLLDASGSATPMPAVAATPPPAEPAAVATAVPTTPAPAPAATPAEPAKSTQPAPATPAITPVLPATDEPAKVPTTPAPKPESTKIEITNPAIPEPAVEPQPTPLSAPSPTVTETEAVAEDETKVADAASTQSTADEEAKIKSQIESFVQTDEANTAPTTTPEVVPEPIKAESATPTVSEPEPEQSDTPPPAVSEEGDKVVVDAVDNLLANTSDEPVPTIDEPQPAKPEATEPAPDIEVPEMPQAADAPAAPEIHSKQPAVISPTTKTPEGDNVAIAHKKIISPIANPNPRPDLDTLLAQEEVNSGGSVLSVPVVVSSMDVTPPPSSNSPVPATHQPGSVYGPQNDDAPTPNDPSSIAL